MGVVVLRRYIGGAMVLYNIILFSSHTSFHPCTYLQYLCACVLNTCAYVCLIVQDLVCPCIYVCDAVDVRTLAYFLQTPKVTESIFSTSHRY